MSLWRWLWIPVLWGWIFVGTGCLPPPNVEGFPCEDDSQCPGMTCQNKFCGGLQKEEPSLDAGSQDRENRKEPLSPDNVEQVSDEPVAVSDEPMIVEKAFDSTPERLSEQNAEQTIEREVETPPESVTETAPTCIDKDKDGSCANLPDVQGKVDCDDDDKQRFPGNKELCDNKDNDCDGVVDNGCAACVTKNPRLRLGGVSILAAHSWSSDGTMLAALGSQQVHVWDPKTGQLLRSANAPNINTTNVDAIQFIPHSKFLAWTTTQGEVWVWDLSQTQESIEKFKHPNGAVHLTHLAVSHDGRYISVATTNGDITYWFFKNGKLATNGVTNSFKTTLYDIAMGYENPYYFVAYISRNTDSQGKCSGKADARRWFPITKTENNLSNNCFSGDAKSLIRFHPDGDHFAMITQAGRLEYMSFTPRPPGSPGRAELWSVTGVKDFAFSPKGDRLAALHTDGTIKIYHTQAGPKSVQSYSARWGEPLSIQYSKDGLFLSWVTSSALFVMHTSGKLATVIPALDPKRKLAVDSVGRYLATLEAKANAVVLWEAATGLPVHVFTPPQGRSVGQILSFAKNGTWLLAGSKDIEIWDVTTKKWQGNVPILQGGSDEIIALTVDFAGTQAAFATSTQVGILELTNLKTQTTSVAGARVLAFSQKGSHLAVALSQTTQVFALSSGLTAVQNQPFVWQQGNNAIIIRIVFQPNDKLWAVLSNGSLLEADGLQANPNPVALSGFSNVGEVKDMALSPDGLRFVVSVTSQQQEELQLWGVNPLTRLSTLSQTNVSNPAQPFQQVRLSQSGRLLVALGGPHLLSSWECPCSAGDKRSCYDGAVSLASMGECATGQSTCAGSETWGACMNQVLPAVEVCDSKDNDCNGKVDEGCASTLAGNGNAGFRDGAGQLAQFDNPSGLLLQAAGTLWIADANNHRIRSVDIATGQVKTTVGSGKKGTLEGAALSSEWNGPEGLAWDGTNNLYILDTLNHRIRVLDTSNNRVSLVAGSTQGFDEKVGAQARFSRPTDAVLDGKGKLYFTATDNHRVLVLDLQSRQVTSVAGSNTPGDTDGIGSQAQFRGPTGLALDTQNNVLYVADTQNHRIRKIDLGTKDVTTLVGSKAGLINGITKYARFTRPWGLALDQQGKLLYVADSGNHVIRKVDIANEIVYTVAGTAQSGHKDGMSDQAQFNNPVSLVLDGKGLLYISDQQNHRIRKLILP